MSTPSDALITNLLLVYTLTSTGEPVIKPLINFNPRGNDPAIIEYETAPILDIADNGILTIMRSTRIPLVDVIKFPAGVIQVIIRTTP
jgi:hypothetical protein